MVYIIQGTTRLILKDDDVFEPHDFNCRKMLRRLRLRARFVTSDKEQRSLVT
jgi:hypothetical protein